jgi:hypothetical protein
MDANTAYILGWNSADRNLGVWMQMQVSFIIDHKQQ